MAEHQARLEAIDAELRQLDPEIERLAKRQKRADQKASRTLPLLTMKLLFLYVITGYNSLIPSSYLAGQGFPHGQQKLEAFPGEFRRSVEDAFLAACPEVLADLELDPAALLGTPVLYKLSLYVLEHRIFEFVSGCSNIGVAPRVSEFQSMLETLLPQQLPESEKGRLRTLVFDDGFRRKNWLFDMRDRWQMRFGKLPLVSPVTHEEVYVKLNIFYQ